MGYQFAHIEGYARKGSQQRRKGMMQPRKWGIRDIAAEAERAAGACSHVAEPQPPVLLHGVMPSQAVDLADAWAATATDASGRKLRADGLCLLAGVVSLPADRADDWPQYRAATVAFLRAHYGERLRSVIEHTDEPHPHLHFYAVPLPGERFEVLHAGRQAAAQAARAGKAKGQQNEAYKAAMVAWQDDFQATVAASFGLARTGPKRQRLTRAQWKARQAQLRADAKARQVAGVVITPELVQKRVTKKGRLFGAEYETGEQLAARLDAAARRAYAPVVKVAGQVAAARHRADAMQAQSEERGEEAAALRERLRAVEEKAAKATKDLALYQQIFMSGLDGPEQAAVMDTADRLRKEKAARAKAEQEAAWSPEVRAMKEREEAEFQRSLRAVEAEERRERQQRRERDSGPSLG